MLNSQSTHSQSDNENDSNYSWWGNPIAFQKWAEDECLKFSIGWDDMHGFSIRADLKCSGIDKK